MNQTLGSKDITDIRLPLMFIFTGLIFFVLSQAIFTTTGQRFILGMVHVPAIWSSTHFFILGFAAMVAMGAMYQLVPVACQVKIASFKWGYIQYVLFTLGVLGIGLSFLFFSAKSLFLFGSLTVIAVIIFIVNMGLSLQGGKPSFIKKAIGFSLTYFGLTVSLGLWMVFDFLEPHYALWHSQLLTIHITLGLNGWFALLIIGFSYKLIPMFSLSHKYETKLPQYTLWLLNGGLVVNVIGVVLHNTPLEAIGWIATGASYLVYMFQIRIILKNRLRKHLDLGLQVALLAWCIVPILMVFYIAFSLFTHMNHYLIVYVVLMGWIGFNILGFLFKIIPFLWWTYQYSEKIGHEKVPTLKEMLNEKIGQWIFGGLSILFIINLISVTFHIFLLFTISQTLITLIGILYLFQLLSILRRKNTYGHASHSQG